MPNLPISADPVYAGATVDPAARYPIIQPDGVGGWIDGAVAAADVLGQATAVTARVTAVELQAVEAQKFKVATLTGVSGTRALDTSLYDVHDLTLTGDVTLELLGAPTRQSGTVRFVLRQDGTGGHDVTWPWQVAWAGGAAPDIGTDTANQISYVALLTLDNGATWLGTVLARGVVPGAAPPIVYPSWTPLALGQHLRAFYDFSGAGAGGSTITSDGSGILTVSDLSGNGRTLTPLGGQPDLIAASQNGLSVARFTAATFDMLVNDAVSAEFVTSGTTNKSITIIALVKPTLSGSSGLQNIAGLYSATDDDTRLRISYNNNTFSANRNPDNNTGGNSTASVGSLTTGWFIEGCHYAGTSLQHHHNTVLSTAVTPTGVLTPTRLAVGGKADITPDGWLNGDLLFVVVTDIQLSTQDRQRVEGWMAHKAALLGLLDVSHPYKTVAPTTAPDTGVVWFSDYAAATDLTAPIDATQALSLWMGQDIPNYPGATGTLQHRITVVENVDVPGVDNGWKPSTRALRVELHPYWLDPTQISGTGTGDVTTTATGPSNRAEIYGRRPTGSLSGTAPEVWPDGTGQTRWYGFSFLFPADFPLDVSVDSNYWFDFIQWKGLNGGSPPLAMEVANGNKIRVGGTRFNSLPNNGNIASMTPGEWMALAVGIRHTWHTDGWVEAWINGLQVLPRTTISTQDTFTGRADPTYLKQGIYRAGRWDNTPVLYFSETKVARDRASVMVID